MIGTLASCSSKAGGSNNSNQGKTSGTKNTVTTTNNGGGNSTEDALREIFRPRTSSAAGAYATITISKSVELDESAWIGVLPTGTVYTSEVEADEVDITYFYMETYVEGEDYVYACDFSYLDNGTYALILANTDDEEKNGYIIFQLEFTKTDDSVSFNYATAVLNNK